MQRLTEDKLALTFSDDWEATQYDEWSFYRNRFKDCCCGNKAMDFLALAPGGNTLWLIELKDYRFHARTKPIPLWNEVAIKTRDTLAGLFAAKVDENHAEQAFAKKALATKKFGVVLHLEQTNKPNKLFRRAFDVADVQQKLKQLVKPIDAHPLVIETTQMGSVPWEAETI